MKFALTKKGKIIIGVVAALIAVIITLSLVLVNVQFAKENISLSSAVRSVLAKSFDKVEYDRRVAPKRVIDSEHPLNLVSYNGYGDIVTLWNTIPEKQKDYTVILLVPGQILLGNSDANLHNLEKWADSCEANQIPYIIQCLNGETHMEARTPVKYIEERFAAKHDYFYGLNASELYCAVNLRGVAESDNSLYLQNLIKLCARYGGYFVWTESNLGYKNGVILEWLENNDSFYNTFKMCSDYICLLGKESKADAATLGVMKGLWLSGLVGNWGIESDCYFGKNKLSIVNLSDTASFTEEEWGQILSYSENLYAQSMMLAMSGGGTCFSQGNSAFSVSNAGQIIAGYEYAVSPLLNSVIDGSVKIPNRDDVFGMTKFVFVGRENYNLANYDSKQSLLYPQNGNSGIMPLLPIKMRKAERIEFLKRGILLVNHPTSDSDYLDVYGKNDSDTMLTNVGFNWYFINNYHYQQGTQYAKFAPKYASATSVYISAEENSSAIISDDRGGLSFYLSNYRTDKTAMLNDIANISSTGAQSFVGKYLTIDSNGNPADAKDTALRKTVIEIKGSYNGGEPVIEWKTNKDGSNENGRKYNFTKSYNTESQILRLEFEHNGVVEFDVLLDDSGKDYIPYQGKLIDDIYSKIKTDTTKLQELTAEKITDSHNYTYFSYLEYDRQFERAVTMINEQIYTQKEVDKQVKLLTQAKDGLINISKEVELIKQIGDGNKYQAAAMIAYDKLLRELLSCQKYVEGRSNDLSYKSIYKNKSLVSANKAKPKAIKKAYENLLLYTR